MAKFFVRATKQLSHACTFIASRSNHAHKHGSRPKPELGQRRPDERFYPASARRDQIADDAASTSEIRKRAVGTRADGVSIRINSRREVGGLGGEVKRREHRR